MQYLKSQRNARAAIVVCGGSSRRMGRPKHLLRFGSETALQRILTQVISVVDQVIVVVAAKQSIAQVKLPASVFIATDRIPDLGPLEGLASGWSMLGPSIEQVFVCGCDTPGLSSSVVQRLFERRGDWEAVIPYQPDRRQVLTAVYHRDCGTTIGRLRAQGCRRMTELADRLRVRYVAVERFRDIDPGLASFQNINTPADYAAALRREDHD